MRRRFLFGKKNKTIYLTIEALEDDFTVSLSSNACEYCIGGGQWITLNANTSNCLWLLMSRKIELKQLCAI